MSDPKNHPDYAFRSQFEGMSTREVISAGLDQAKRLYEPDRAYIWIDDKGFHIEPIEKETE